MKSPAGPPVFTRDSFSDVFLRCAAQLDALQPPVKAVDRGVHEELIAGDMKQLLPSRERIGEILRTNARFRPCEDAQRQRTGASTVSGTRVPPRDVHVGSKVSSPRRDSTGSLSETSTTLTAPAPTAAAGTTAVPVLVPVGGRARVFQPLELSRARRSLKKRSLALTNLQALHPATGVAGSSAWDLQHAAPFVSGKQALIAELVARTSFSTQHIFHMSRTFKEIAGVAKSVISFAEFRALLSDDVGALLLAIGVGTDDAAFQQLAPATDLRAISATISASDSFLRRLFATFDGDGDGKIDFREFVLGLHGFVKGSLEDKVDALFDAYRPTSATVAGGRMGRNSSSDEIDAENERGAEESTAEMTVAISDLLGLFQGDRQLYQELMRCVDEYFARIELRDSDGEGIREGDEDDHDDEPSTDRSGGDGSIEEAASISRDDFVAASLAEPRLLETITRPTSSLVFSEDAVLRERLRAFVERHMLGWRAMGELQSRVLSLVRSAVATVGLVADAGTSVHLSPTDLKLPSAQLLPLLTEISAIAPTNGSSSGSAPNSESDSGELNLLLRAYLAKPSSSSSSGSRTTTPATVVTGAASSSSSPLVDVAALLQDLAVVLAHPATTTQPSQQDTDAKARYYFQRFDLNGDGLLSRHELVTAVCAGFAHFGPSLTEVVRVLEDEDADQDGELTKAEYLRAARRSPLILASLYTCL